LDGAILGCDLFHLHRNYQCIGFSTKTDESKNEKESAMLDVTPTACEAISDMLAQGNAPEDVALRLATQEGGALGLSPDRETPSDTSFAHGDRTVLVVDEQLANDLDGRVLDATATDAGVQLTLNRPDA